MDVEELLSRYGPSYAEEAGIKLTDKPGPLYQLLVLTTLLSGRIKADIAVRTARCLFDAGWKTPAKLRDSTWQQRVDVLGRGGYKRYDESTARYLADGAELLHERYKDDLRKLAAEADQDPGKVRGLLEEFPKIGPTGAEIFCREAQAVWPFLRPSFDKKALDAAKKAGLPTDPAKLAARVKPDQAAVLAAALVRYGLDTK
ncbi:endonuclease [Labedaea rhizosphaerae]|uniref:Endonuclease III n=1 Tax=Labedaea rhizosphaerae TaxID=598644 RepID=A0A4R6SDS9_LABRH|nr:endonuclease [Labedaea rhizosphaerae]TDP97793.1 hypothetical protein EV186_103770 [Labedaea rhizosphaerae]